MTLTVTQIRSLERKITGSPAKKGRTKFEQVCELGVALKNNDAGSIDASSLIQYPSIEEALRVVQKIQATKPAPKSRPRGKSSAVRHIVKNGELVPASEQTVKPTPKSAPKKSGTKVAARYEGKTVRATRKDNPYREGSAGFAHYQALIEAGKKGIEYSAFYGPDGAGLKRNIKWDRDHDYITID